MGAIKLECTFNYECKDLKKIPLKKIAGIGIPPGNPKFPKIEFSFVLILASKYGPIL
jgi:hypothetical protein